MPKPLKSLRLAGRLGAGFGLLLLLLAACTALSLYSMRQFEHRLRDIVEVGNERVANAQRMMNIVNEVSTALYNAALSEDAQDVDFFSRQNTEQLARYAAERKALQDIGGGQADDPLVVSVDTAAATVTPMAEALMRSLKNSGSDPGDAFRNVNPRSALTNWLEKLGALVAREREASTTAYQQTQADMARARMVLLAATALALALGVAAAVTISRGVTRPISEAVVHAERVAAGDLAKPIVTERLDETGDLLRALAEMQQRLRDAVQGIRAASDSIGTASQEVASGSMELSGRTEQTAGSLQQTAGSLQQLTGNVRQTAESAHSANQLAATAAEAAERGGSVVEQVVHNMADITASSRKIGDIIGVIDGIAFQTNILALNAAVEAARAGEQGRGFAVVAGEVRLLAQRSAEAAREIKALIGASVDKVESGSRLVEDAGATMREIVASVARVSSIIGEITTAASEQSQGIGQVNGAISQLDGMTQQNSALVEQSAAAADSLQGQARRLAELVNRFRLSASA